MIDYTIESLWAELHCNYRHGNSHTSITYSAVGASCCVAKAPQYFQELIPRCEPPGYLPSSCPSRLHIPSVTIPVAIWFEGLPQLQPQNMECLPQTLRESVFQTFSMTTQGSLYSSNSTGIHVSLLFSLIVTCLLLLFLHQSWPGKHDCPSMRQEH